MADITLRLIWYKVGEVSEKMAEASRTWYSELDFDSYVLDLLLLGWCTLGVVVILAVNAIVAAFGPLQKQPRERYREIAEGESLSGASLPLETAKWFNNALNWFYLHYYHAPEFMDDWLRSLNEQLQKLGGPVQARFERIQSGSLPPKITHVSCEASPQDKFIIHARLESRDLSFVVFASQQTQEGVKLTNCTASVLRLKGTLKVQSYREGVDVKMSYNFEGKPEIKVQVKPLNPYQETHELVDLGVVEANVRNSIILAKTTFTITHMLMPGDLQTMAFDQQDQGQGKGDGSGGQDHGPAGLDRGSNLYPRDSQNFQRTRSSPSPSPGTRHQQQQQQHHQQQQQLQQQQLMEQHKKQQHQQQQHHLAHPDMMQVPVVASTSNKAPLISTVSVQNEPVQNIPVLSLNRQLPEQHHHHQQQQLHHQQQLQQQQQLLQQQIQQVPRRDQQRVRPQSRPEGVFEPVEAVNFQNTLFSGPPKPPRMIGDKRLLVKIIKANGLSVHEPGASSITCMVSTDEPIQGYSTSIVKNTQNPFWDEHFLFDITQDTQEVRVEMYDREEFLGEAIVYVEDLRKTPSSRQILRLHPQPGNFEYNSGTVTAELLFMDPAEADLLLDSMTTTANSQLSPRRRIEVARSVTPGGTVVTKTTTTTQRPQYGRHDPGIDDSPNYIEKNVFADESPRFSYSNDSPSMVSSGMGQHQIPTIESSPPEGTYPYQMNDHNNQTSTLKDDLDLVRMQAKAAPPSPNLKKSRTLGGSLKKLFRRSRKKSQSRADSRESSVSRGTRSKGPSRDNSLTRQNEQRASSVS